MQSIKKYLAEAIGTFVLVLFACGTAVVTGCSTDNIPAYLCTALAFGLVIVAMAYSIGNISGCHINPAVSVAMLISKKMTIVDFCGYVVAQFIGGIAGAAILGILCGSDCGFGANGVIMANGEADVAKSLLVEIILTFVFLIAILGVTSKPEYSSVAGIVIGLSLTLVHIFGIAFTGTSVNPARSFASAIMAQGDALKYVWVFIVGPVVGAALAAFVYMVLSKEEPAAPAKAAKK